MANMLRLVFYGIFAIVFMLVLLAEPLQHAPVKSQIINYCFEHEGLLRVDIHAQRVYCNDSTWESYIGFIGDTSTMQTNYIPVGD